MSNFSLKKVKSESILIGVAYALSNSFDLFNDGIILLKNKRLCRAYTLFQLSMEEAGKVFLLLDLFVISKIYDVFPEEEEDLNKHYRRLSDDFKSHSKKTKHILTYELHVLNGFINQFKINPDAGISIQRDILEASLKDGNKLRKMDDMKNYSLYTSFESDKFVQPMDKIDINEVNNIKFNAFSKLTLTKNNCIRVLKGKRIPQEINITKLEELKLDHFDYSVYSSVG